MVDKFTAQILLIRFQLLVKRPVLLVCINTSLQNTLRSGVLPARTWIFQSQPKLLLKQFLSSITSLLKLHQTQTSGLNIQRRHLLKQLWNLLLVMIRHVVIFFLFIALSEFSLVHQYYWISLPPQDLSDASQGAQEIWYSRSHHYMKSDWEDLYTAFGAACRGDEGIYIVFINTNY